MSLLSIPFHPIIEGICFIVSIACLLQKKAGYWQFYCWYMLVVVVTESTGFWLVQHQQKNYWIYNLYLPIEGLFIGKILFDFLKRYLKVRVMFFVLLSIFCLLYIDEMVRNGINMFCQNTNTFLNVTFTVLSMLYFYFFLKQSSYIDLSKFAPFWIISGIFLFFMGSTACTLFAKYLVEVFLKTGIPVRYIIYIVLNIILYGCWSYGFICKYKDMK